MRAKSRTHSLFYLLEPYLNFLKFLCEILRKFSYFRINLEMGKILKNLK